MTHMPFRNSQCNKSIIHANQSSIKSELCPNFIIIEVFGNNTLQLKRVLNAEMLERLFCVLLIATYHGIKHKRY